jgi:hypothetical protein
VKCNYDAFVYSYDATRHKFTGKERDAELAGGPLKPSSGLSGGRSLSRFERTNVTWPVLQPLLSPFDLFIQFRKHTLSCAQSLSSL